jgi:hypothetical protein
VRGAVPVAVTEKVASCPAVTVWLTGCVVIVGETAAALTVKVTVELGVFPAALLTTTWNVEPLSAVVVAGVV